MSLMRRLERGQSDEEEKPEKPVSEKRADTEDLGGNSRLTSVRTRRISSSGSGARGSSYVELKNRVQNRLLSEIDVTVDVSKLGEVRRTIQELFEQILVEENIVLTRPERQRLFESIAAEILGFGPLQPVLADRTVTEIMVNGYQNVYVERAGK